MFFLETMNATSQTCIVRRTLKTF